MSKRWTEYTGLTAEDTAGWGWRAAVHPDDIDRHADKWRASLASGEPFEDEARFRRAADGEYRWFLARAEPLRDEQGTILKWYGMLTDIEDRKQADQAQRDSEEQWRATFESSPTMNFMVDEAGAHPAGQRIRRGPLGYDVDELVGQPVLNVFLRNAIESRSGRMQSAVSSILARRCSGKRERSGRTARCCGSAKRAVPSA